MLADQLQKTRKNIKVQRNRKHQIHLPKRNGQGMFSTRYGLYGAYKDLHRRTASDIVLPNKVFGTASNPE